MKRQIIHLPRFRSGQAHVISPIKPKWMNHPATKGIIGIAAFHAIRLRRIFRKNVQERLSKCSHHLERRLGAESRPSTAAINVGCFHSFLAAPPSASSSDPTFSVNDKTRQTLPVVMEICWSSPANMKVNDLRESIDLGFRQDDARKGSFYLILRESSRQG